MSTNTSTDLDVTSDLSGVYVKRADVEAGDVRFTIAGVARETFEGRDGRPAQTRVVLTSTGLPPRKFSLNKVNLRTIVTAWGKLSNAWIGQTILIHFDPTIEVGGNIVGGQRIRIPQATVIPPAADVRSLEAQVRQLQAQLASATPTAPATPASPIVDDDISFAYGANTGPSPKAEVL